uniref:Peptidase S1 domain-containing protein n=1 Tax=Glossina austeni TaxID=7395 RepID=A0A1A9V0Q5_GLOAU
MAMDNYIGTHKVESVSNFMELGLMLDFKLSFSLQVPGSVLLEFSKRWSVIKHFSYDFRNNVSKHAYNKSIDYADGYASGNGMSYEDAAIDYDTTFYYKKDDSNEAILENVFDSEGDFVFLTSYDQTDNSQDLNKYAVSIRLKHTHHCVGCIIRADLVLTAAHCFRSKRGDFSDLHIAVDVVAGQKRRLRATRSTQIRKAKRAILNECWNSSYDYCDIALVQLDREFNLNDYSVAPLDLPKRPIAPHTLCSTCGWGNGPQADEILYTDYLITPCKHNSGIICANPINTTKIRTGLCDSGTPLICDDVRIKG